MKIEASDKNAAPSWTSRLLWQSRELHPAAVSAEDHQAICRGDAAGASHAPSLSAGSMPMRPMRRNLPRPLCEAIIGLNEDTLQAAAQVASSETKIRNVPDHIALEQKLDDMSNQLELLQNKLLTKVQHHPQQNAKSIRDEDGSCLCQVVPLVSRLWASSVRWPAWQPISSDTTVKKPLTP